MFYEDVSDLVRVCECFTKVASREVSWPTRSRNFNLRNMRTTTYVRFRVLQTSLDQKRNRETCSCFDRLAGYDEHEKHEHSRAQKFRVLRIRCQMPVLKHFKLIVTSRMQPFTRDCCIS